MASNTPTPAYADLEGLSPATIAQLEKLLNRHNDSLSIAFYREWPSHCQITASPWWCRRRIYPPAILMYYLTPHSAISTFVYLTILYINAKFLEYLFTHFSPIYRKMTHANQRTSVMYILNIVHTTAVLVLQLIAAPSLAREYTVKRTDLIRIAAMIVSVLYLFEIIYRASMRTQMLIHHFAVSRAFLSNIIMECS